MRELHASLLGVLAACAVACGAAATEPKQATDEYGVANQELEDEPGDEAESKPAPRREAAEEDAEEPKAAKGEPVFTEGMSVAQAIDAIPQGMERVNIEEELLSQPLADPKTYEACKLKPGAHFKLKVAIWDGRAVGIDVTSSDKKLAECIRQQVSKVEWRQKAKSLNTVEYQM